MSFLSTSLSFIVASVLIIFLVVGVHEYGHFIVARWLGVHVQRFSIGFGKIIYRLKGRFGTEFCLALVPLGGYVKFFNERQGNVPERYKAHSFNRQALWKRGLIIAAGPLFNFLFAILLFWGANLSGYYQLQPIIGKVSTDSIAQKSGVEPGDTIVGIDGWNTSTWQQAYFAFIYYLGDKKTVQLKLESPQKLMKSIAIDLSQWQQGYVGRNILDSLGIKPYIPTHAKDKGVLFVKDRFFPGLKSAATKMGQFVYMNVLVVYKVLIGKLGIQIFTGPIGLLEGALKTFEKGWIPYLLFMAYVSLAIGIMNLLPIPGLDGCQLLYLIIEKFKGRPISVAVEVLAFRLGMIALMLLLVQVIINDIKRML